MKHPGDRSASSASPIAPASAVTQQPDARRRAVYCRQITKDFPAGQEMIRVLHGVDLEVKYGEQTFIVGPSGCGKTTLVSVIAGLLRATSGDLEVMGQDIHQLTENQLVDFRARKLGFIFQQFNLLPALNAAENAAIPLLIQGIRMEAAVKQAEALLERLQMGPHVRKYPNQLSGGQQQRVAIARSLIHQPQLLICDEPTASLDAESGQAVMELLRDLASAPDRAVLVVTHDNRIFSFADTIAHISDGRITRIESKTGT